MNEAIKAKLPSYPIALEPVKGLPAPLAGILDGLYKTSDAGEAATLAEFDNWIICDVVWDQGHPQTWVLGRLREERKT